MDGQFSRKSVPCFYELESPVVVRTMKFIDKHCALTLWPCSKKEATHKDKGPLLIMLCPVAYNANNDAAALLDSVRDGPDIFLVLIKTVSDKGKEADDLSRFSDPLEVHTRNRVGGSCVLFFSNTDAFKKFKTDNHNALHEIKKVIKQISQGKKWSTSLPTAAQLEPQFRPLTIQMNTPNQIPPSQNKSENSRSVQIMNTVHVDTPDVTSQQATASLKLLPLEQSDVTSSSILDDAWKVARPVASQGTKGVDPAWNIPRPVAAVSNSTIPNLPPPPELNKPQQNKQTTAPIQPAQSVNFNNLETLDVFYYFPKGSNIETQTVQFIESKANVAMKLCKEQNLMVISPLLLFAPCHKQNEDDAKAALKQARDGDDVFLILIEPIYDDRSKTKPVHISDATKERLGALASLAYSVDCHCFMDTPENMVTLGEIRTFFRQDDCVKSADPDSTFLTLEVRDPSDAYESYV